jgi:phage-related baseplate assembly protein
MLTLSEMFTPLDKDTVLASILDVAEVVGLPVSAWQSGSVVREILEVVAQKIADFTQTTSAIASGGLLDFAAGGWLTLLAISAFGQNRTPATFGTTTVNLTNISAVSYVIAAGDLHFLNSSTGKTYVNTTGGSLLLGGGTLTVTILADESGSSSNAVPGAINALVTPLLGVTMTNPTSLIANDEETDTALRIKCRASLAAASPNGPADAYNYFATAAVRSSDGSSVGVTRTKVVQTNGNVTVYIASAAGAVPGAFDNPATDLGAVHALIQSKCVPTGITESTVSATELPVLVAATIYLKHGSTLDPSVAKQNILTQLQSYFKEAPIGGYDIGAGGKIYVDAIVGQIYQAAPAEFIEVVVTTPVGTSVSVTASQVAVLTSVVANFTIVNT